MSNFPLKCFYLTLAKESLGPRPRVRQPLLLSSRRGARRRKTLRGREPRGVSPLVGRRRTPPPLHTASAPEVRHAYEAFLGILDS